MDLSDDLKDTQCIVDVCDENPTLVVGADDKAVTKADIESG